MQKNRTDIEHHSDHIDRIATLLAKKALGQLTGDEQNQLDRWLAESPHGRRIIDRVSNPHYVLSQLDRMNGVDAAAAADAMKRRLNARGRAKTFSLNGRWGRVAAACVAAVVVAAVVVYRSYVAVEAPVVSAEVMAAMQLSRESGCTDAKVDRVGAAAIRRTVGRLTPRGEQPAPDIVEQLLEAKRITTRSDKEYWVALPDGSLVHLNYDTRLIYPEQFVGSTRDVILEGEAYFMVARDRRHPFIVHTPHGQVKQYGTEFNVDTRTGGTTSVVLVAGSISLTPACGAELMVQPGEKSTVSGSRASVEKVDVEPYVAWNTGQFLFDDCPLERIMEVVGRWYGYTVEFADADARHAKFSGNFRRYDTMDSTIESIALLTGLDMTVADGTIVVGGH